VRRPKGRDVIDRQLLDLHPIARAWVVGMHGRCIWGSSALSVDNEPRLCWSNLLGTCNSMVSKMSPSMAHTLINFMGVILECLGLKRDLLSVQIDG
jgi:hypothetical protein